MAYRTIFSFLLLSKLLSVAQSHGTVYCPACAQKDIKKKSLFVGRVDFGKVFKGTKFPETGTDRNYEMFKSVWDPNTLSVKEIIQKYAVPTNGGNFETGQCDKNGAPVKFPKNIYFGRRRGSFLEGVIHVGAAEVYCDDIRIMVFKNFQDINNPGNKGLAKIDLTNTSWCAKAKTLQLFWTASQSKAEGNSQVYVYYLNIDENASPGTSGEYNLRCPPNGGGSNATTPGNGGSTPTTPGNGGSNPTTPGNGGSTPTTPGNGGSNPTTPGNGGSNPTTPGNGGSSPITPKSGGSNHNTPKSGGLTLNPPGSGGPTSNPPESGGSNHKKINDNTSTKEKDVEKAPAKQKPEVSMVAWVIG
ncbi:hypothetical protein ABG067_005982 [Albugo candida]